MVPKRAAALAAAALALAGCGESENKADREAVERSVKRFAQADGPEACRLLSPDAIRRGYGGRDKRFAYGNCLRRSKKFEGERVEVEDVDIKPGKEIDRAFVRAKSPDESRRYRIGMEKLRGAWLIDSISLQDVN